MPRVICTSPNASTLIDGIAFEPHPDGGMISEDIDEARAARLAGIPGFRLAPEKQSAPKQSTSNGNPNEGQGKADDQPKGTNPETDTEPPKDPEPVKDPEPAADKAAAEKQSSRKAAK